MRLKLTTVALGLLLWAACSEKPKSVERAPAGADGKVQIRVDGEGYHPPHISAPSGKPVTLVFTRTTDETCGQKLVFPSEKITRELPLNSPVAVVLTPRKSAIRFTCGMNMYEGSIVAQ
jgi:plastocyanin domain-containing protein